MPLLAQSGLTLLVYLVVGIFWLLGNLLQQKQARQRAEDMRKAREAREEEERRHGKRTPEKKPEAKPEARPEMQLEKRLQTFLEQLSGEPPPTVRPREPVIIFDTPPPPLPARKAATPPKPPPRPQARPEPALGITDLPVGFKAMAQMKDAEEIIGGDEKERQHLPTLDTLRAVKIDLTALLVDIPRVPMQSMRTVRTRSRKPALRTREGLRRAYVAATLLETPKGLRPPSRDGEV